MKRFALTVTLVLALVVANSQNVQLHYDLGKDRSYLTSTIEMFKPDNWGSTFFFVDMDYGITGELQGMNLAYLEFARAISLGKNSPLAAHLEYNGGFFQVNPDLTINIEDAWLAGLEYSYNNEDYSQGITFQTLYKHIVNKHDLSFQLTAVWYAHFWDNRVSFMGFADFWREDRDLDFDGEVAKYVFMAEPQLWYNVNKNLALGSEVEFSNNFITEDFKIMPTLGIKWEF